MKDVEQLLPLVFEELAMGAPHDPGLARAARRAHGRRRGRRLLGAAGLAAAATALAFAVPAVVVDEPAAPGTAVTAPAPPPPAECPPVRAAVLPPWARAGFSDPEPVMPFVLSDDGDLAAIVFGPLASPPDPAGGNKILWVPRVPLPDGARATAVGHLRPTGDTFDIRFGPVDVPEHLGPSGLDLPEPGCWQVDVTWGGRTHSVLLPYASGPRTG